MVFQMTKLEILFYNALISLPFALLIAFVTGDVKKVALCNDL